ncbi:hypothetical protein EBR96_04550 [bacterium]|nr:hypothetical protein [bacterium]
MEIHFLRHANEIRSISQACVDYGISDSTFKAELEARGFCVKKRYRFEKALTPEELAKKHRSIA